MRLPIEKNLEKPLLSGLLSFSRAAFGCGVGLLLADRIRHSSTRQTTGITLVSLGVIAALPSTIELVGRFWTAPHSPHQVRRRLRSIREDSGFASDEEIV